MVAMGRKNRETPAAEQDDSVLPNDVKDYVERALEPFRGLPPDDLAAMRARLLVYVETHPGMRRLLGRLQEHKVPDQSATMPTDEGAAEPAAPVVASNTGGQRDR